MIRGILLLALIVAGIYVFKRWSNRAGPAATAQAVRKALLWGGGGLALLLLLRGGVAALPLLLPLLLPWLLNGRGAWRRLASSPFGRAGGAGGSARPNPNGNSAIRTRYLQMELDHAAGAMHGSVIAGQFKGHDLQELDFQELSALWRECSDDPQSVAVLEAYFDHALDADWREKMQAERQQREPSPSEHKMGIQEAYEILGLQAGANREEIKQAHRRLMQKFHPDHGGSAYLAIRINQAKDLLMENLR